MKSLDNYLNKHEYSIPEAVCEGYKYIWAWGKMSGSMDYYIARQVKKAIEDGASKRATYYDDTNNVWRTVDDCCEVTRNRLYAKVGE